MSPLLESVCLGIEVVCLAAAVEVGSWVAFRCVGRADQLSDVADYVRTRAMRTESAHAAVLQHVPCLPYGAPLAYVHAREGSVWVVMPSILRALKAQIKKRAAVVCSDSVTPSKFAQNLG
ncbi:hypothetical protein T492DRAFT_847498 [Pavlovales sp. CCMP2436]|nr:hypothetical protein T492DRAFT_847498 [Pavlovales sp. CCMP2436]